MKLSDFDYNLPKNLIAHKPASPRDSSRLLCLRLRRPATANVAIDAHPTNCARPNYAGHANYKAKIEHKHFFDLPDYLNKGDILVLNNSKVFPARLIGKKKETGGKIEVFLLHKKNKNSTFAEWQCLLGGHGRKENLEIEFAGGLKCKVLKNNGDGTWEAKFNMSYARMMKIVEKIGQVPLPPYIKRNPRDSITSSRGVETSLQNDKMCYQTIYADKKKIGSVAAPTAGLHFTPDLIKKLKDKGVRFEYVTLHVGIGTFAPVKIENIKKHKMHAETVEIDKETIARIYNAKLGGRRVIAVGTTSVRTIEAIFSKFSISNFKLKNKFHDFKGLVDIFIYPGYKFKIIDAMITNFHLPKSTLLMLVSAFAGKKNIDKAYEEAIKKKYRFYSYGDAMLLAPLAEPPAFTGLT